MRRSASFDVYLDGVIIPSTNLKSMPDSILIERIVVRPELVDEVDVTVKGDGGKSVMGEPLGVRGVISGDHRTLKIANQVAYHKDRVVLGGGGGANTH